MDYGASLLSPMTPVLEGLAWLLDKLAERDARIAELEARLQREWMFSLP